MKNLWTMFSILTLLSTISFADDHKKKHKHYGAHVHGAGHISLAFDGLKGRFEFKAPAEAILGFEHEAKSEKDKKTLADAISKFETETSKLVQFSVDSNCSFAKDKVSFEKESDSHADFLAYFDVVCQLPIFGTKVTFDFTSFQKLHNVDVTVLVDDLTKTGKIGKRPLTIELKK
jgi:hypothetical protein